MRHPRTGRRGLAILGLGLLLALTACTETVEADAEPISVVSSDDACEIATSAASRGNMVFEVTNEGSQVTEFYLYESDGRSIVGEVEDIGPGLSRRLVVQVEPGEYVTACKPGMVGDGIRAGFTVTDS